MDLDLERILEMSAKLKKRPQELHLDLRPKEKEILTTHQDPETMTPLDTLIQEANQEGTLLEKIRNMEKLQTRLDLVIIIFQLKGQIFQNTLCLEGLRILGECN